MKVGVPIFTEEPNAGKEAATLLNVNADGKWTLISDVTSGDTRTLIYGYNEILPGNNSITGTLMQSQGYENITDAANNAGMTTQKQMLAMCHQGRPRGYTLVRWNPESFLANSK